MQKIKRNTPRTRRGVSVFFKTVLVTAVCLGLIALGYFAASWLWGGTGGALA